MVLWSEDGDEIFDDGNLDDENQSEKIWFVEFNLMKWYLKENVKKVLLKHTFEVAMEMNGLVWCSK